MIDELIALFVKYQSTTGFLKGGEFLLAPEDALTLIDDISKLGVTNLGLTGWYIADREKNWIGEALESDFYVGDAIMQSTDSAQQSAAACTNFIKTRLSPRIAYISLTLDIPIEQDEAIREALTSK